MNNYQKYRLYKNKYLQLKAGSPCTKYHGKPFRCWKTDGCFYKVANGQCATKASLNPQPDETPEELQTRNEGSRQKLKSRHYHKNPFYRDAAATLIGNRVRHRQRHRGEAAARVQRAYRRHNRHEISITVTDMGDNTLIPFHCHKNTPIISLLEFIKVQTGDNLSSIKLYLDLDPRIPLAKELRHQILDFMSGISATDRDKPVSVISDDTNINLIMIIGKSDHEKLERFVSELPEKVKPEVKWTHTDILCDLDLNWNQLTQLPNTIGDLSNLNILNLHTNRLTQLPDTIGNLNNLTELNLGFNKLTQLPNTIGDLSNLNILNLNWNSLTQLPNTIGDLSNLNILKLHTNQRLTQLPDTIGNLTNLTQFELEWNSLTQLPDSFGNLTNLTRLYLTRNQLTQLPDSIGNLTNLISLNLGSNRLTQLPNTIGNLTNLRMLGLYENQLTQLPDSIGNLNNLKDLSLWENQLTQLPDSIGNLNNLKDLSLWENQLTQLPDTIGNLTNLNGLYLRDNPLTQLPDTIGHLKNINGHDYR